MLFGFFERCIGNVEGSKEVSGGKGEEFEGEGFFVGVEGEVGVWVFGVVVRRGYVRVCGVECLVGD